MNIEAINKNPIEEGEKSLEYIQNVNVSQVSTLKISIHSVLFDNT